MTVWTNPSAKFGLPISIFFVPLYCCSQILVMYDALEEIDAERVAKYIASLQKEDGSFTGDKWGEVDTRFSFCAVACLSLMVS